MRTTTPEEWEAVLRVNLTAPAFLARWAAEAMLDAGRGVIVNLGSIEAFQPQALCPAYVAAKAGLLGLTSNLAALYGPRGIRVVSVSPGVVDTALSNDYVDREGENLSREIREETEDRIPLCRWARPEEIARAVLWLSGDEASYISGTDIVIDGGWTRHRGRYSLTDRMLPEP